MCLNRRSREKKRIKGEKRVRYRKHDPFNSSAWAEKKE
jgi:hypothetical protein